MPAAFDPTGGRPGEVRFFLPGPVWVREAVRQAMREVRKEYAHPFYWAPFVLVGKHD